MIDVNDLECLAKKSPDECFLNGRGVLKLISGIRLLEGDNRRLNARLESIAAATRLAAIEECIAAIEAERLVVFKKTEVGLSWELALDKCLIGMRALKEEKNDE